MISWPITKVWSFVQFALAWVLWSSNLRAGLFPSRRLDYVERAFFQHSLPPCALFANSPRSLSAAEAVGAGLFIPDFIYTPTKVRRNHGRVGAPNETSSRFATPHMSLCALCSSRADAQISFSSEISLDHSSHSKHSGSSTLYALSVHFVCLEKIE
jgi:hypothetical protein